jgi:hypothetical protein
MRNLLLAFLAACCAPAWAQQQEIQRALIQRDQQSAEFAAQVRGGAEARAQLETLHARQLGQALVPLSPNPSVATSLLPYQRSRMSDERELRLPPPIVRTPALPEVERALPLPGGPRPGVDPVAPDGVGR